MLFEVFVSGVEKIWEQTSEDKFLKMIQNRIKLQ